MVALCVVAITFGTLKKGQDIAGGYSMTFKVDVKGGGKEIVEQIVRILKKRLDPEGLNALKFRTQGNDTFEVQMPAASDESRRLRDAYLDLRDRLLDTNIRLSNIRKLAKLPASERADRIAAMAGGVEKRAENLGNLTDVQRRLDAITAELAAIEQQSRQDGADVEKLTGRKLELIREEKQVTEKYNELYIAVNEGNIDPRVLTQILELYEKAYRVRAGRTSRMNEYRLRLDEFKQEYPGRADLVDRVADAYENWCRVKRELEDPEDVIRMIRKAGILEFRIAPIPAKYGGSAGEDEVVLSDEQVQEYVDSLDTEGPGALLKKGGDYAWFPVQQGKEEMCSGLAYSDYRGRRYVLLSNRPGERLIKRVGEDRAPWRLKGAWAGSDQYGSPAVHFNFNEAGARYFSALTGQNISRRMAILLDDEVYSAPSIRSTISSRGQITGSFTGAEVSDLARILQSGSLPGRIREEPESFRTYGASIGEENKDKGYRAAWIGLIAVAAFMMLYYLFCGAIADVALLLNLVFVVGAMVIFGATMTLPGIAGLVLTVGVAVDANVLIFERLREEQDRGLSPRQAIKNAYERAFTAIFDANITTILICLFLYIVFDWVAMSAIRGFAVTLGLGIAFSMFTALVVTRWFFLLLLKFNLIRGPLPMLRLIPVLNVNWIGKRYYFWFISATLLVVGLGSVFWQKGDLLGIEFSSGSRVIARFKDDALLDGELLDDAKVRRHLKETAEEIRAETGDETVRAACERLITTARVTSIVDEERVAEFIEKYAAGDETVTAAEWRDAGLDPDCHALLAGDDDTVDADDLEQRLPNLSCNIENTADEKTAERIVRAAFGGILGGDQPREFRFVRDETIPALGIALDEGGGTVIPAAIGESVPEEFRAVLIDSRGGLLWVLDDIAPAMSAEQLANRLRLVRTLPDYIEYSANRSTVLALPGSGADGGDRLAVVTKPVDTGMLDDEEERERFIAGEKEVIKTAMGRGSDLLITSFNPEFAAQTSRLAVVVVILSWLTIVAYLWFRFGSVRWGLAAVICLVHDIVIVVGLVAMSGWLAATFLGRGLLIESFKLDLPMVAALMTIIGYSVNDTIVVFDRIRENRGKLKALTPQIINSSINQVLPRTILTSFTTLLAVLMMYILGGSGIRSFNYALLAGIMFGTYSSVAIASPLLMGFKQAIVAKVGGDTEEQ